ncbi:MAG: bifunctional chorismate mutase/prephenate dehydratase [Desulfovibrionaceae bacterium]|nr:bifunctional chorismate mutase/prephenate dehydratase [Desulfovibrionaceae bacterium]
MTIPQAEADEEKLLEPIRAEINRLDAELLVLLNQRAACSLKVGAIKKKFQTPVFKPGREQSLLRKLSAANRGPLGERQLLTIYREIFSVSRDLQRQPSIAYLGPEGAFSHIACLEYFGKLSCLLPKDSFGDIFEAVERRICDLGVIPMENSLHGAMWQCLDLFTTHEVYVQAEWINRIHLSLISRENSLSPIRVVYSHAQPLGQCARWLRKNLPGAEQVLVESSAAAVRRVTDEANSAAIGHAGLAERLDLHVLAVNLEDSSDNWTRFFAIGPEPGDWAEADRSSIIFALGKRPGALSAVLDVFAGAGINMSKLESRPLRGERWHYIFFTDLDCNILAPEHQAILEQVREHCDNLKVIGAYMEDKHVRAV